jgi:hypothetical protein
MLQHDPRGRMSPSPGARTLLVPRARAADQLWCLKCWRFLEFVTRAQGARQTCSVDLPTLRVTFDQPNIREVPDAMARRCPVCETVFTVASSAGRQVFCSSTCRETNRQKMPAQVICPVFTNEFTARGRPRRIYCSAECRAKAFNSSEYREQRTCPTCENVFDAPKRSVGSTARPPAACRAAEPRNAVSADGRRSRGRQLRTSSRRRRRWPASGVAASPRRRSLHSPAAGPNRACPAVRGVGRELSCCCSRERVRQRRYPGCPLQRDYSSVECPAHRHPRVRWGLAPRSTGYQALRGSGCCRPSEGSHHSSLPPRPSPALALCSANSPTYLA